MEKRGERKGENGGTNQEQDSGGTGSVRNNLVLFVVFSPPSAAMGSEHSGPDDLRRLGHLFWDGVEHFGSPPNGDGHSETGQRAWQTRRALKAPSGFEDIIGA